MLSFRHTMQISKNVAEITFKQWSHIQVQQPCCEDAVSLWKSKMKIFFKNTCHESTDTPEVVARRISIDFKRSHEDINGNLQTNKGAASAWGMPIICQPSTNGKIGPCGRITKRIQSEQKS